MVRVRRVSRLIVKKKLLSLLVNISASLCLRVCACVTEMSPLIPLYIYSLSYADCSTCSVPVPCHIQVYVHSCLCVLCGRESRDPFLCFHWKTGEAQVTPAMCVSVCVLRMVQSDTQDWYRSNISPIFRIELWKKTTIACPFQHLSPNTRLCTTCCRNRDTSPQQRQFTACWKREECIRLISADSPNCSIAIAHEKSCIELN